MDQTIINWFLAGFGGLIGFMLTALWQIVKGLQNADARLAEKVASIEILVAGSYITRPEFDRVNRAMKENFDDAISALFKKLDKIDDKLDRKADK